MASRIISLLLAICASIVCAQQNVISPFDPNIAYSGRVANMDGKAVFDWPGVQISFTFTGRSVTLLLEELQYSYFYIQTGSYLNIILDGRVVNIIQLQPGVTQYLVVADASSQSHVLQITKRTEALVGTVAFSGLILDDGATLSPPPIPSRFIEFIGDSITCGYGNQGLYGCSYTPPTQNNYDTYEGITSRNFNAAMSVVAWSGKGVVRNCCFQNITTPDTLPDIYPYTIASYANATWEFATNVPDAVVINLGTNDYSTPPQPPQDIFETGYINFIKYIRSQYAPATPTIFLACGPMIGDPCCSYVQNVAATVGATYIDMENLLVAPMDYGCDGHPSVSGHWKMSQSAIPVIQKTMGW
eukprot:TRINITY_DN4805_c0_g1_i1.p1 TRINITY_DN4805_c0_g1~~TRINITY_DN4805_c0_g1_i1.p1  ORF type:complete len:367 (-),score=92.68 TRINITY_DN4805_c0_g1_i1:40-1113(-)